MPRQVCPTLLAILLASCGEDLTLVGDAFLADNDPLTVSGQVLDGEGRPLWGIEITATDQRIAPPPLAFLDDDAAPHTVSNVYGTYTLDLETVGPTWLHFGYHGRTVAWLEIDAGNDREADVVLAEEDVVHCQLLGGESRSIASYSMFANGAGWGFGWGGGCISSHGTCGPEALTFLWPSGFDRVDVRLDDIELTLSGWDEPCEAVE